MAKMPLRFADSVEPIGVPVTVTTRMFWTFLPMLRSPATRSRPRM